MRTIVISLVGMLALASSVVEAQSPDRAMSVVPIDAVEGRAAIDGLIGQTLVSAVLEPHEDLQEGLLFLRPDGTAAWVNIEKGAVAQDIRWSVNDQARLCMSGFPEDSSRRECAAVSVMGQRVRLSDGETNSDAYLTIRVVPGNPYGL